MKKKEYFEMEIEIIRFQSTDIVTASGGNPDPDDTDWGGGQIW